MFLTGCTALLLLFGVITPGYTDGPEECTFPNLIELNKDYHLVVSPKTLYNNTVYTVNVTGKANENVRVLLQAQENNTAVGTWSTPIENVKCAGEPLLNFTFNENNSLIANWTSPSSLLYKSVEVNITITNGKVTHTLSEKLVFGAANSIQPFSLLLTCILVITSKLL